MYPIFPPRGNSDQRWVTSVRAMLEAMKRHESGLSGKPPDDRLTILYHRVLDFAKSDHETALLYARKYGEAFCREMGAGVGDGPNSRPRSIEDLLRELSARNLAPRELIAHLRTIQAYGNAAARR